MTLDQWIGVWLIAASVALAAFTAGVVGTAGYMTFAQEERRHGLRRGWSRPEAGVGRRGPAAEGSADRETLARVGWVGVDRVNN